MWKSLGSSPFYWLMVGGHLAHRTLRPLLSSNTFWVLKFEIGAGHYSQSEPGSSHFSTVQSFKLNQILLSLTIFILDTFYVYLVVDLVTESQPLFWFECDVKWRGKLTLSGGCWVNLSHSFCLSIKITPGLRDWKQIVCLPPINCGQHRSKMERNEERRWLVNDFIIQNVSMVLTPCILCSYWRIQTL